VKAVVLVGGEGTRLRPLTLSAPKQMLPIVEVPMIERVLGHLGAHGIDEAVLSIGYLPDAFLSAYPDGMSGGVALTYAHEPEPLDTAGAVRFAADHVGITETFVVVNGDVLTDLDVTALIEFHREHRAQGTIHLHPVPDPSPFGVVPTDFDGRVTAFLEKPSRDEAPTNLINAGTYVLEPSALERIPSGRRVSIERETFPAMVRDGVLFAMADDSYWLDAGTPSAFLEAHRDLIDGHRPGLPVAGARRSDAGWWVKGSPKVSGTVTGACYFGDGAVVAEGAIVDRSVLSAGCVVESGVELRESVLLAGARVAANSVVSGSVLGPGSTVGERCDVRPVSVLGEGAVLASGTVLDGERVPG